MRDYDEIIRLEPDDPSVRQQRQAALEQAEAEAEGPWRVIILNVGFRVLNLAERDVRLTKCVKPGNPRL